jgi:pimeloyl-ACP methyl ester carboxylesterase
MLPVRDTASTDYRLSPANGRYLRLTDGMTHWRREGPGDGEPVVLVHGATVPSWEFDPLVPLLLQAGFQTLRFDLYGHGASDRPRGDYSFERFARQIAEVIEASAFPRPAMLIGHSFGAALVAAMAAARPDWTSRLVLVAPMLDFSSSTRWTTLFRCPGIGELAMQYIGMPALIRRRRLRYERIGLPHLTARFIEQVSYAGFSRGLLSMFRTGALGDQSPRYAALRNVQREMLVIAGEQDAIVPAEHVARVRSLLPSHRFVSLPAEHNLLLTHPREVTDAVVTWMTRVASTGAPG